MITTIKQELFKFWHQRIPLYGVMALLLLMLEATFSRPITPRIIAQGFGLGQWTLLIIITLSSTFLSMEYKNNTICTMFYKSSSKSYIYLSKYFIVIGYGIFLLLLGLALTIFLKITIVGDKYSWNMIYQNHRSLLTTLLLNLIGNGLYLFFMVSLCFMLISIVKINVAVIGLGMAIGFIGNSLSGIIMTAFPNMSFIWKWNPLNMINIINQLPKPNNIAISQLSNLQIIIGVIVDTLIFLGLGYWLFKKRRV